MNYQYLHRKESVILTAIEIIDELGIQELTSKQIATRQGISEGTLFKHFSNKNEILRAVLEHYGKFDQDIIESIKLKGLSPKEGIKYFITAYAEYYQNYPAITSIIQCYDVLSFNEVLREEALKISQNKEDFLKTLIQQAQQEGEIDCNLSNENLSYIILGFFRHTTLKWRQCQYSFSLKEKVLLILHEVMEAFAK